MENTYHHTENITMLNPKKIRVIKAKARENLLGNYGPIIGATILISLISTIISVCFSPMLNQAGILQYGIYYVADFIIVLLVNFFYTGIYVMHLNAGRGEKSTLNALAFPVRNGTNRFLAASAVFAVITFIHDIPTVLLTNYLNLDTLMSGTMDLHMIFIWSVITLIASIVSLVLMLDFALTFYFLIDNPEMSAKEAFANSHRYMKGNRLRLLFQYISFIGLGLLGLLTAGIAYLWLIPYMEQSVTVLYETLVYQENTR
ncbi:MAG: DUF975 family protein [Lachnospiraceae bacterium]